MATQECSSVEVLSTSLNSLRTLRSSVTLFFKIIAEGPKEENGNEGDNSFHEMAAKCLADVKNNLR